MMDSATSGSPTLSVVVPLYNEEAGVSDVIPKLCAAMDRFGRQYEVVAVDDGSSDRTWEILQRAAKLFPRLICYRLSRNFGHQAAVYAGLCLARGEAIGVMDGDGQDPPEVLIEMFRRWEGGCEVAYAVRRNRKESWVKRLCYWAFYRVFSRLTTVRMAMDSGDFSVMDRRVVDFIKSMDDPNPFIRGLRSWYGGTQVPVEYDRQARQSGQTKYSWFKLMNLAVTGITSFSKAPLRAAIYAGGALAGTSFVYGVFIILRKAIFDYPPPGMTPGWSSLIAAMVFLSGVHLLLMGFIGEYIAHIFDSCKRFPAFIVRERTGDHQVSRPSARAWLGPDQVDVVQAPPTVPQDGLTVAAVDGNRQTISV